MELEARKCVKCGHEWAKRKGAPEPKRCPNHKCRSTKWKEKQEEPQYAD